MFSYTHTDTVARFQRMRGEQRLLPDRLGRQRPGHRAPGAELLRRALRPVAAVRPRLRAAGQGRPEEPRSRSAGRTSSSCASELVADDEEAFEELFRRLGLSVDWRYLYTTIGDAVRPHQPARRSCATWPAARRTRQEAPTLWDVDFRTAVAQAELEDRERARRLPPARLPRADGAATCSIDTTRPELIAACVALVAHPDDERYQPLFGTTVRTPLFGVEVPVVAHQLAEPDKGTGIAMICTFGDTTDVTWWRELDLPTRADHRPRRPHRRRRARLDHRDDGRAALRASSPA